MTWFGFGGRTELFDTNGYILGFVPQLSVFGRVFSTTMADRHIKCQVLPFDTNPEQVFIDGSKPDTYFTTRSCL